MLIITKFTVSDKRTNCYICQDQATGRCVIIDPGEMTHALRTAMEQIRNEQLERILLTHCHYDHVAAAWEIRKMTGALISVYADDALGLGIPVVNRTGAHGRHSTVYPPADILLTDGQSITVGETVFTVLHTPGHTIGSCCYVADNVLFSGDTLFREAAGKTNLPTGDTLQMTQSLQRLAALEGDYRVCPGHGEETSLAHERAHNPFLNKFIFNERGDNI